MVKGGAYAYGSYPDLDAMFEQQAVELDHGKRAAILTKMQQILYERVITHASLAACLHQWRGAARAASRTSGGLPASPTPRRTKTSR